MNLLSSRTGDDQQTFYTLPPEDADRHMIFLKLLMISNEGEIHTRQSTSLIIELTRIGGMLKIVTAAGGLLYWWFVEPFRDLDLSISFNRLKNKICQEEGITHESDEFDKEHEKQLGCCFYAYLWLVKRTYFGPLLCTSNYKGDGSNPSYEEMVLHFDELKAQVTYQMSLKHLAKSTILG